MLFSKKKNRLLQEMADCRAGTDSQISLDRFGVPKSKEILKKKTKLKHTDGDMKSYEDWGDNVKQQCWGTVPRCRRKTHGPVLINAEDDRMNRSVGEKTHSSPRRKK